jgi:hypothetical protein
MHRQLLVALVCVTVGSAPAFAQQVISPYEGPVAPAPLPQPAPIMPAAQPQPQPYVEAPMVPPPVVVPPPSSFCGPPDYCQPQATRIREVEQPRYGLMTAGLVILGASWSINAGAGYLANEWRLYVPVVGPFFETARVDTSPGNEINRPLVMLLVFDGLIETAGAAMFIAGAVSRHKVRVYDRARVAVVPTAGYGTAGLAAFGRF